MSVCVTVGAYQEFGTLDERHTENSMQKNIVE